MPICLINDPIGYDADFQAQKLKSKIAPSEGTMSLRLRNAARGDISMEISNLISIEKFKTLYTDKLNEEGVTFENVRLFAMGKELKNDLFLYSYEIINESTIQVMIRKSD